MQASPPHRYPVGEFKGIGDAELFCIVSTELGPERGFHFSTVIAHERALVLLRLGDHQN